MSSLWTPGGEHAVPRVDPTQSSRAPQSSKEGWDEEGPGQAIPQDGTAPAAAGTGGDDTLDNIGSLEAELLAVPVADVVANHCYALFQLAAVHLGQRPPRLDEAQVAIDALGAVVERLGERLGEARATLVEAVTQIRLAYVQIAATIDREGSN